MTINSQFLFFYIDELIKHHWVDWLEGPLGSVPPKEHSGVRGFQEVVGDTGAGPRTRAGEAYQLGILSGRIVRPQIAGASFPSGWQEVIEGRIPATKLGFYSYIIGKALRDSPNVPDLERALDCLASILVLHIGFYAEERWFNTVLIFQFAFNQLESSVKRELTNGEIRYLSAAVIHTLNSDERKLLLRPYVSDRPIKGLRLDLKDSSIQYFELTDLVEIVEANKIKTGDFKKDKASLFWASPARGIFSRASRSQGSRVIQELMKVDQGLANQGKSNLLSTMLEATQNNADNVGIFDIADENFADFPKLLNEWQDLDAELFDATNKAAEAVELDTAPPIWLLSQREIRGEASVIEADEKSSFDAKGLPSDSEETEGEVNTAIKAPKASPSKTKKPKKELTLPSLEALQDFVEREFDQIFEHPPVASEPSKKAVERKRVRAQKTDFAEKEARNRKLGEAGELFILQYEIHKLIGAGQDQLAERVSWQSKVIGDGLGYDIRSFDLDGSEIFLEVKTTTSGRATPFFVSSNEVSVSEEKGTAYRLVRVFGFPTQPRFFTLSGSLSDSVQLEATSYRARV